MFAAHSANTSAGASINVCSLLFCAVGLFRVLYDTRNWMAIVSTLNDPAKYEQIHALNRVQLIEDSLSFAHTGEIDYGIAFQLLKYLNHEKQYTPWMAALGGLSPINKLMKRTPNQGVFQVS